MMPRHSMTLSRHQDRLLQTPATLETLGSTSAVPYGEAKYNLIAQLPYLIEWGVDAPLCLNTDSH